MRFERDLIIRYRGVEFVGQELSRGSREGFGVAGWEGLLGGVDQRREQPSRLAADGSHAKLAYAEGRYITVRGQAVASSPQGLIALGQRFDGLQRRDFAQLNIEYANQHYVIDRVGVSGRQKFEPFGFLDRATYTLKLWSPDSNYYGGEQTFEAVDVAPVWHRGNDDAYPIFTFAGAFPAGFRVVASGGGGQALTTRPLDGINIVDMRTLEIRSPGGDYRGTLRGDPIKVAPSRDTWLSIDKNGGSGYIAKVRIRDTYI